MSQREVLVFDQQCVGVADELARTLPDWRVLAAKSVREAIACIDHVQRPIVGLVRLDGDATDTLEAVGDISDAIGVTEWIALVERELLDAGQICQFLSDHFYDFHILPLDTSRLAISLDHAHGRAELCLKHSSHKNYHISFNMVGNSPAMQKLFASLIKIRSSDAPVLIHGESGTGKELVARAVHQLSSRSKGPFVAINCGAIPTHLIQTELFGHEKGAFTGAHQRKIGLIESAHEGAIFLDEIGDLPLDLQVNLLRFLQERKIERVGSIQHIKVDVRVIAATHVDLEQAVAEKHFREDLYYRLNVLRLSVPPLRERWEDIEPLVRWCFDEFSGEKSNKVYGVSNKALQAMRCYSWPGNVRELINKVRSAMVMSEHRLIQPEDMGLEVKRMREEKRFGVVTLDMAMDRMERDYIQNVLDLSDHNVSISAKQLGLSRSTLYRIMKKLNVGR